MYHSFTHSFKVVAAMCGWTHIVLLTDDETTTICWYGAKPFDDIFGKDTNYSFTWLRQDAKPTTDELDGILRTVRSLTRGVHCVRAHRYRFYHEFYTFQFTAAQFKFLAMTSD